MARVALVRVDTTVSTVCPAAGFLVGIRGKQSRGVQTHGGLLYNDGLDAEVVQLNVFRVGIRLGVLQQAENEFNRLFRPPTWCRLNKQKFWSSTTHPG